MHDFQLEQINEELAKAHQATLTLEIEIDGTTYRNATIINIPERILSNPKVFNVMAEEMPGKDAYPYYPANWISPIRNLISKAIRTIQANSKEVGHG